MRASTQPYALLLAQTARQRFSATWAVAESGATGPAGNRYGDPAGHSCIAVAGRSERAITLETGSGDRLVQAFTDAHLHAGLSEPEHNAARDALMKERRTGPRN